MLVATVTLVWQGPAPESGPDLPGAPANRV